MQSLNNSDVLWKNSYIGHLKSNFNLGLVGEMYCNQSNILWRRLQIHYGPSKINVSCFRCSCVHISWAVSIASKLEVGGTARFLCGKRFYCQYIHHKIDDVCGWTCNISSWKSSVQTISKWTSRTDGRISRTNSSLNRNRGVDSRHNLNFTMNVCII